MGHVASAVMLQARLKKGQRLMDIILLTHSLGEKLAEDPETFRWTDASGAAVTVELVKGRCVRWSLARPDDAGGAPVGNGPAA